MTRLQILELPEGVDDKRRPFVLVVDENLPQRYVLGMGDAPIRDYWQDLANKIGARGVIVVPDSVAIPANEPPTVADDPEHAGTAEIVYAHERTRLDLASALLLSGDTAWRKLIEAVTERQRELADLYRERDALNARLQRVEQASTEPEVMDSRQEHPGVWRHGYHCGVLAARSAARPRNEPTVKP